MSLVFLEVCYYCWPRHLLPRQRIFRNYFSCTILLCAFVIVVNGLLIIKRKTYKHHYKCCHVIIWIGSKICSTILFCKDSHDHLGIWCWIGLEASVRFGLWHGSLFALSSCMSLIYVCLLRFLMKFQKPLNNQSFDEKTTEKRTRKDLKSQFAYQFISILFSIPIIVYRMYQERHPHIKPVYALTIISIVLTPSLGAVYAVAFFDQCRFERNFRSFIKDKIAWYIKKKSSLCSYLQLPR